MTREEITNEIAKHIPFFRRHFESFCSHQEKCARVRKKAWEDAQRNPRLRDEEKGPPKPGWVWTEWADNDYLSTSDNRDDDIWWNSFWRPAKPGNLARLLIIHAKFGTPIRDLTKRERFLCDCALLSVAHDYHSKLGPSDELIFQNRAYTGAYFDRDEFCKTLWYDVLTQPDSDELI